MTPFCFKVTCRCKEVGLYLAVLELSTTVTVLSWLTQARRFPEAEKETEWTQPPPPDTHKCAHNRASCYSEPQGKSVLMNTQWGRDTHPPLQILLARPQMASCCPRVWDLVSLPLPLCRLRRPWRPARERIVSVGEKKNHKVER